MVHVFFTSIAIPSFLMGLGSNECQGLITVWAAGLGSSSNMLSMLGFNGRGYSKPSVTLPSQLISSHILRNIRLSIDRKIERDSRFGTIGIDFF